MWCGERDCVSKKDLVAMTMWVTDKVVGWWRVWVE
jgi:hypothetical protein